jgi:hypothetical protein
MPSEFYLTADAWIVISTYNGTQAQHAAIRGMDAKGQTEWSFPCGQGRRIKVDMVSDVPIEAFPVCGQHWCQKRLTDWQEHRPEIERQKAEDEAELQQKVASARKRLRALERSLARVG